MSTLLTILGFLISPFGLAAIGAGIILFLGMPVISLVSRFKGFSRLFLKFASFPLKRAAIVVSEHNDILFKQMSFDGLGVEEIVIGDETKLFEDPDAALHYWLGIPFALADEEHGVLFDPRHAAIGARKKLADHRDEASYLATDSEWDEWGVSKWIPGVFGMPTKHELVNLVDVQHLVDGGERSEYAERVKELYKHSQDPFGSHAPIMKYLYPILGFAITFGGIWFMVSQFGIPFASGSSSAGGAAGNAPNENVTYGLLALLITGLSMPESREEWIGLLKQTASRLSALDWRGAVAWTLLVGTPLAAVVGLYTLTGVVFAIGVVVAVLLGFLTLPVLTLLLQLSSILGGALSKVYFRLGLLGYRKPVLVWTSSKYELREFDQIETTSEVTWYNLFGSLVGFSYDPDDAWSDELVPHRELEAEAEAKAATDGGETDPDTQLPAKFVRSEQLGKAEYGAYIPKKRHLSDSMHYINSRIALGRFTNSADGEKSLRKLLQAKELHGGGGDSIDDELVLKMTAIAGLLGVTLAVAFFIIPAFA